MAFKKRRAWTSQPQEAVEAGWSNSLARNLAFLVNPAVPVNLASGRLLTVAGNAVVAPSELGGLAFVGDGTGDVWSAPGAPTGSFDVSLAAIVIPDAVGVARRILFTSNSTNSGIGLDVSGANVWQLTKGGVAAINANVGGFTAGDPYFFAASYRHSPNTIRTRLRNLMTGAVTTGSPSNSTGFATGDGNFAFGGTTVFSSATFLGRMSFGAIWLRALSEAELAEVDANPWQLFAPQTILVPVSAGGTPTLTVPDSAHAHALDNVVLTANTTLAVQDMAHGHALDAPTLSTGTALAVADSLHAHSLDNVTLSTAGSVSLTVADSLHAHALDNVGLTSEAYLAVADMLHAHAMDGVTVTLGGVNLTVADLLHSHALDNATLTLDTYLAVADALHGHVLDSVALDLPEGTLDLILKILRNRQELNPSTGKFTLYDDDGTTILKQSNAWADVGGTQPYSGGTLARIDALI